MDREVMLALDPGGLFFAEGIAIEGDVLQGSHLSQYFGEDFKLISIKVEALKIREVNKLLRKTRECIPVEVQFREKTQPSEGGREFQKTTLFEGERFQRGELV